MVDPVIRSTRLFVKRDLQMQRHGFDLIIPGCFGKLVLFLYVLALVALDNDVRGMADGVHVLQVPWICCYQG